MPQDEFPGGPSNPDFDPRSDSQRRIDTLRLIAGQGGAITPRRNPAARNGHDFGGIDGGMDLDLKFLADRDYLENRFFDRVSTCPKCQSHHLNVREICPTCASTNFTDEPMLHHFRCGYVGRISEFSPPEGGNKRICPKCNTQLKYLGTDHDHLGKTCLCINCGTSFQDPPASAVCLTCNCETPAADLAAVEINGYSLTTLGAAALRRGSLFETESEVLFFAGLPVYRPSVTRELLAQEAKRGERFKTTFTLLFIRFATAPQATASEDLFGQYLQLLRDRLRGPDILGQINDTTFALCMPQTNIAGAEVVHRRLIDNARDRRLDVVTSLVEITKPEDLSRAMASLRTAPDKLA